MSDAYEIPIPAQPPPAIYEPVSSPLDKNAKIKQKTSKNKKGLKWGSVAFVSVITTVSLGLLIAILVISNMNNDVLKSSGQAGQPMQISDCGYPDSRICSKSCLELGHRGAESDGIYTIKPEKDSLPIEVYCDMKTDGGGWTLVASVHENDIRKKCSKGDLWSDFIPSNSKLYSVGDSNWGNEIVFGDVLRCTEFDYKNIGYYSLNSSDVMIWHVPSGLATSSLKENIRISYRTTNNFLRTQGGNLRYLYKSYYPLKWDPDKSDTRTAILMEALSQSAGTIKAIVKDWYDYGSFGSARIHDKALYHIHGNRIYFGTSFSKFDLEYGKDLRFSRERIIVATQSSIPFMSTTFIPNRDRATTGFHFQVDSYIHEHSTVQRSQGSVTSGNYKLQYRIIQFLSTNKPTPCEFYFILSSINWKSIDPSAVSLQSSLHGANIYVNIFKIFGNPSNIAMGYILLATKSGNITDEHANNIAGVILAALQPTNMNDNNSPGDVLAVPVVYDKGSDSEILNMIPPVYQSSVVPGYIQFLSFNFEGYPNAICPGVRSTTLSPEYVCIGGLSNDASENGTCGDFAGWSGVIGDAIKMDVASGSAHSQKDLFTTFLIFYR